MGFFRKLHTDERGIALASVSLLGSILVMSTALMTIRVVGEGDRVDGERSWETALQVAEGGVDIGLDEIAADFNFTTGESISQLDARSEIIKLADEKSDSEVRVLGTGEVVLLKPQDKEILYAVGYSPSRDAANREVRVVEIQYELVAGTSIVQNWSANHAILSGGDIIISGNPTKITGGGNVHANKDLSVNAPGQVSGCAYSSGISNHTGCGADGMPEVPVPIVDPTMMWDLSMYDMCPDGFAHFGPAHPTASEAQLPTSGPCSGLAIGDNQGWLWGGSGSNYWAPSAASGVFYVHGGNVSGTPGRLHNNPTKSVPAYATIIAARLDGSLECGSTSPGGTIDLVSQFYLLGDPSAGGVTAVAGADLIFHGGGEIQGLVLAHESVDYAGNAGVVGGVIEEDACDSSDIIDVHGAAYVHWTGPIDTPFDFEVSGGPTTPQITYIGVTES